MGQLPLSVWGLSSEGVEQFGRSEVLFPFLESQLPFLNHVHESIPTRVSWAVSNDLNPNMGRVTRLTARWSCSTMLLRYFTCRMMICVPYSSL